MIEPFSTTGIGSLPHTDPEEACRLVFDSVDIPFWPQLPALGFQESMIPQYAEGFPFVAHNGQDIWTVEAREADAFAFYSALEGKDGFPISKAQAAGLYAFLERLEGKSGIPVLKGQITGPLTFTLGLTDKQKKPLFFDEEKRELALALLKGKAVWQIKLLRKYADRVIIFIDEPILSALGTSTYIGVSEEEAGRLLRETVDAIRDEGGISAIHCCSKAHWPLVVESGVDILNFDAFFYADSLKIFPDEVRLFMDRGGLIAWGVVPTTSDISDTDVNSVGEKLRTGLKLLRELGVEDEKIRNQSLLTPSCGAGSLTVDLAERVFSILRELKAGLSAYI